MFKDGGEWVRFVGCAKTNTLTACSYIKFYAFGETKLHGFGANQPDHMQCTIIHSNRKVSVGFYESQF